MEKEQVFTIFGGTGDLTFRKLLPALYNIEAVSYTHLDVYKRQAFHMANEFFRLIHAVEASMAVRQAFV